MADSIMAGPPRHAPINIPTCPMQNFIALRVLVNVIEAERADPDAPRAPRRVSWDFVHHPWFPAVTLKSASST